MKEIINNKFAFGFFVGVILTVAFNIVFPIEKVDFNGLYNLGYPFSFYREGYISHDEYLQEIFWFSLAADTLIALLFCSAFGVIFKIIAPSKLK